MPQKLDDYDALRIIVQTLESFERSDQERIVKWACEKLGITTQSSIPNKVPVKTQDVVPQMTEPQLRPKDIKTFYESKKPKSDNQFAALVAYYYRFEAPEDQRKEFITGSDLQDASRLAGHHRFPRPAQTLINATKSGYLDNTENGKYRLNTVGENLIAMVLPDGAPDSPRKTARKKRKSK